MLAATDVKSSLNQCLDELHLLTVRACYEEQADRARQESLSYEHYLAGLMGAEREERLKNRITRLLRESKLPLEKTLETFELSRLPAKVD